MIKNPKSKSKFQISNWYFLCMFFNNPIRKKLMSLKGTDINKYDNNYKFKSYFLQPTFSPCLDLSRTLTVISDTRCLSPDPLGDASFGASWISIHFSLHFWSLFLLLLSSRKISVQQRWCYWHPLLIQPFPSPSPSWWWSPIIGSSTLLVSYLLWTFPFSDLNIIKYLRRVKYISGIHFLNNFPIEMLPTSKSLGNLSEDDSLLDAESINSMSSQVNLNARLPAEGFSRKEKVKQKVFQGFRYDRA